MRIAPLALLLLSCAKQPIVIPPSEPPPGEAPPASSEPSETSVSTTSSSTSSTTVQPPPDAPPPAKATPLWALDEALADALASPLTYVGTGEWFGIDKVHACVYRNAHVFVVNIYCTPKEMTSVGVVVLSPKHGRVYFYGEAKKPISAVRRADYFSFFGESEPVVVDTKLPALDLGFTYAQLRAWDEKRYRKMIASCSAGVELQKPLNACVKDLKPQTQTWVGRNKPFVDAPTDNWYRIVRDLRARAKTDGKNVGSAGG